MGEAGRRYSLANFTVEKQADLLARTFSEAVSKD